MMKRAIWIAAGPLLGPMDEAEAAAWLRAFRPWGALVTALSLALALWLAGGYLDWGAQPQPPACEASPSPWACLKAGGRP